MTNEELKEFAPKFGEEVEYARNQITHLDRYSSMSEEDFLKIEHIIEALKNGNLILIRSKNG